MRIQYASDLHLEFRENSSFLKHNPLAVAGEVLVLAGDIGYIGDENYSRHPFWDWASGNYSRVIVVPGNHEFYKMFDIDKLYNGWSLKIRENITSHDVGTILENVKNVACVNRTLHYHSVNEMSEEMLETDSGCPIELIAHGDLPHRVLRKHND
jgi:hypothetical protein